MTQYRQFGLFLDFTVPDSGLFQPNRTQDQRRVADGCHQLWLRWKTAPNTVHLLDAELQLYQIASLGMSSISFHGAVQGMPVKFIPLLPVLPLTYALFWCVCGWRPSPE